MTICKTGADHLRSLKDGRTVYIDGKLAADVTEHPAFRNCVKSAAALYDFQARPENIEPMHQPRLADAAESSGDGQAPQGPAGLGGAVMRVHRPFARSCRFDPGRPAHRPRCVPEARPAAREGAGR